MMSQPSSHVSYSCDHHSTSVTEKSGAPPSKHPKKRRSLYEKRQPQAPVDALHGTRPASIVRVKQQGKRVGSGQSASAASTTNAPTRPSPSRKRGGWFVVGAGRPKKATSAQGPSPTPPLFSLAEPEGAEGSIDQSDLVVSTSSAAASSRGTDGNGKRLQYRKTQLCPWVEQGRCYMNDQCNYAHTRNELRYKPDLSCTKLCSHVEKGRACPNSKCRFAHDLDQLRATSAFFKTKMCKFWMNGHCPSEGTCRHAHGKAELRAPIVAVPSWGEEQIVPQPNRASTRKKGAMEEAILPGHRLSTTTDCTADEAAAVVRSGARSRTAPIRRLNRERRPAVMRDESHTAGTTRTPPVAFRSKLRSDAPEFESQLAGSADLTPRSRAQQLRQLVLKYAAPRHSLSSAAASRVPGRWSAPTSPNFPPVASPEPPQLPFCSADRTSDPPADASFAFSDFSDSGLVIEGQLNAATWARRASLPSTAPASVTFFPSTLPSESSTSSPLTHELPAEPTASWATPYEAIAALDTFPTNVEDLFCNPANCDPQLIPLPNEFGSLAAATALNLDMQSRLLRFDFPILDLESTSWLEGQADGPGLWMKSSCSSRVSPRSEAFLSPLLQPHQAPSSPLLRSEDPLSASISTAATPATTVADMLSSNSTFAGNAPDSLKQDFLRRSTGDWGSMSPLYQTASPGEAAPPHLQPTAVVGPFDLPTDSNMSSLTSVDSRRRSVGCRSDQSAKTAPPPRRLFETNRLRRVLANSLMAESYGTHFGSAPPSSFLTVPDSHGGLQQRPSSPGSFFSNIDSSSQNGFNALPSIAVLRTDEAPLTVVPPSCPFEAGSVADTPSPLRVPDRSCPEIAIPDGVQPGTVQFCLEHLPKAFVAQTVTDTKPVVDDSLVVQDFLESMAAPAGCVQEEGSPLPVEDSPWLDQNALSKFCVEEMLQGLLQTPQHRHEHHQFEGWSGMTGCDRLTSDACHWDPEDSLKAQFVTDLLDEPRVRDGDTISDFGKSLITPELDGGVVREHGLISGQLRDITFGISTDEGGQRPEALSVTPDSLGATRFESPANCLDNGLQKIWNWGVQQPSRILPPNGVYLEKTGTSLPA